MGSYANFMSGEYYVAGANRKFFGYIEDEEFEKTKSYQFLKDLNVGYIDYANVSYIGCVCEMTYHQMMSFMYIYTLDFYELSNDKPHDDKFHEMWDTIRLPPNYELRTYQLCFD